MSLPEDHGVILLAKMLDELDGRQVHVTVHGARPVRVVGGGSRLVDPSEVERIAADVVMRILEYRERGR